MWLDYDDWIKEGRIKYQRYLSSTKWRRFCQRIKQKRKHCEYWYVSGPWYKDDYIRSECTSTNQLHVHHVSYENFGNEKDEDVKLLCNHHHFCAHLAMIVCDACLEFQYNDSDIDEAITSQWWSEHKNLSYEEKMDEASGDLCSHFCIFQYFVEKND